MFGPGGRRSKAGEGRAAGALAPLLAIAAAVRVALFLLAAAHPARFFAADSHGYVALAGSLAESYGDPDSAHARLALSRTPGYPAFLAAVFLVLGPSPRAAILAQIVVGVATVWLTFALAERLLDRRRARWAALAVALDPISVVHVNYLLTETLFTALLVGATLLWQRAVDRGHGAGAAIAALAFGAAALTRPIALYLPLLLLPAGWLLDRRSVATRIGIAFGLLAGFAALVGSWTAHTYTRAGSPMVSTIGWESLLYNRAGAALAEDSGAILEQVKQRLREELDRRAAGAGIGVRGAQARDLALEVLWQHPVGALRAAGKGAARTLLGPGRASLAKLLGEPRGGEAWARGSRLLVAAATAALGVEVLAALLGLIGLARERAWRAVLFALAIPAYLLALSAGPEAYARFRVPMVPFLALLAGGAARRSRTGDDERAQRPSAITASRPGSGGPRPPRRRQPPSPSPVPGSAPRVTAPGARALSEPCRGETGSRDCRRPWPRPRRAARARPGTGPGGRAPSRRCR
jgi:4-amino-4-deoxy-L-arabinose transferase-like glycosyltransferase